MKPLMIELFAGLSGWGEGAAAEGFRVVGFDLFDMPRETGLPRPEGDIQLVLQDVLTLHGSQFRDAALIVASPPCQEFSYMAMPWQRAKAKAAALREDPEGRKRLTALFDACFRIQREACEAAGRHIPLVVENVCGAQKWVGPARWRFGSFYLFGDVPALMPIAKRAAKVPGLNWSGSDKPGYVAQAFNTTAEQRLSFQSNAVAQMQGSRLCCANNARDALVAEGIKTVGHENHRDGHAHTRHLTNAAESDGARRRRMKAENSGPGPGGDSDAGIKQHGSGPVWFDQGTSRHSSKGKARKAASAHIAKIPAVLARHIARTYYPRSTNGAPA